MLFLQRPLVALLHRKVMHAIIDQRVYNNCFHIVLLLFIAAQVIHDKRNTIIYQNYNESDYILWTNYHL